MVHSVDSNGVLLINKETQETCYDDPDESLPEDIRSFDKKRFRMGQGGKKHGLVIARV